LTVPRQSDSSPGIYHVVAGTHRPTTEVVSARRITLAPFESVVFVLGDEARSA